MPRREGSPPISVERAYQLWLWLDPHVMQLAAHARAALGARVVSTSLDLLDALLQAAYEPRASGELPSLLRDAARRATLLRFLLRGLRDLRHLSTEQHAYAAERLDEFGRMVSAWRRSVSP